MNIRKPSSKVVHHGILGVTYRSTWCNTSGWKEEFKEHKGAIRKPYRKCKICFRNR